MRDRSQVVRITGWIATLMAIVVSLAFPLGYFAISYQYLAGSLTTEAEINAGIVSGLIGANPRLWRYEEYRLADMLARRPRGGHGETRRIYDVKGRPVAESVNVLPTPVLTRSFELSDTGVPVGRIEISRSLRPLLHRTGFVALIGLSFGVAVFFTLRLLPFRAVTSVEKRLQTQNEELSKHRHYFKEMVQERTSELSQAVHRLQEEIAERERTENELRDNEERLKILFEFAPDGYYLSDLMGTFVDGNRVAEDLVGYKKEELIGKSFLKLDILSPGQLSKAVKLLALNTLGKPTGPDEFTLQRKDGKKITVDIATFPVKIKGRTLVLGIARDATERKRMETELRNHHDRLEELVSVRTAELSKANQQLQQEVAERDKAEKEIRRLNAELERRVMERTAQLEAANKELESFSYSVSHDLRAPLRHIEGFCRIILEDCCDKLDPKGKEYLERVGVASKRMSQLIDDLLNLSRVSRGELTRQTVDLSSMARDIADELRQSQPERQVTFVIADTVMASGDPRLLRVVLDNLLGNAWKYTGKQEKATIEFGATEAGGTPAWFVRDDGVGFDMAYGERLFGTFQRLHGLDEFEGTGIGLATVKRIIHRHGGRVWGEGEVGKGATFHFTLG